MRQPIRDSRRRWVYTENGIKMNATADFAV